MTNHGHCLRLGNVAARQSRDGGHAERVEAGPRLTDADACTSEQGVPHSRWGLGHEVGFGASGGSQRSEDRGQLGMQRGGVPLPAFGAKRNCAGVEVHVGQRIQVGFHETATRVAGDGKGVGEELAPSFWSVCDGGFERGEVGVVEFWLLALGDAMESEFVGWVCRAVSATNRFVHDETECFRFEDGGVVSRGESAVVGIWNTTPGSVGKTVSAGQLSGVEDLAIGEVEFQHAPGAAVAGKGALRGGVALGEEGGNPSAKGGGGLVASGGRELLEPVLGPKAFSRAGFRRSVNAIAGGNLPTPTGFRVVVGEPPKRGASALI